MVSNSDITIILGAITRSPVKVAARTRQTRSTHPNSGVRRRDEVNVGSRGHRTRVTSTGTHGDDHTWPGGAGCPHLAGRGEKVTSETKEN